MIIIIQECHVDIIYDDMVCRYAAGHSSTWIAPPTTTSLSSTSINQDNNIIVGSSSLSSCLPMFVSQCPGWICYAEKSQPQAIPYISTTKSPQQIFGRLIREMLFAQQGIARNIPYVVSIQPCFDKKLESSRRDFYHEVDEYDEIDLVISTTELWNLIEDQAKAAGQDEMISYFHNIVFPDPVAMTISDPIEALFCSFSEDGRKFITSSHQEGGSGGYIDHIIRYAAQQILGIDVWDTTFEYKVGRNPDFAEVEVMNPESGKKLRFARAYGFRNIQSIMQKMKRGKGNEYDMIEIMACPSGCLNGGGQIKLAGVLETPQSSRERIMKVHHVYHDPVCHMVYKPEESKLVQYVYGDLSSPRMCMAIGQPLSDKARELLHTRYHAVPKLETIAPLAVKW